MTSTPCESGALDRLVAQWAAKIATSSGTTVEAIVTHAQNVCAALQELEPHGQKARQLLATRSGLSRSMMSKLETIGRHADPLRRRAGFLPPSVSSLYALARKPSPGFDQALTMDLRGKSRAEITALFALPSPRKPPRKLMTVLLPPDLDEAARRALLADLDEALARIAENHKVDLDVSLPASGPKAEQLRDCRQAESSLKQTPQDRRQDDKPAVTSGDAADTKSRSLGEYAARAIAARQRPGFFTGENLPERQDLTAHCRRSPGPGRGAGPPPLTRLETSAPSLAPPPLAVISREQEDIRRRIARLESSFARRPGLPGSDHRHA